MQFKPIDSGDVFFYGLFLDPDVLAQYGVTARCWRRATLDGFALHIGQRARLTPHRGRRALGAVMSVGADDLAQLYDRPGLRDYRPVDVVVRLDDGTPVAARCFNLDAPPGHDVVNRDYTAKLVDALRRHDFPSAYVDEVAALAS